MKKNKGIKMIILLFFLAFSILYISALSGYFEYENHKNTYLTEKEIRKYEEAIKNGETIDMDSYIIKRQKYSNKLSVAASNLSNTISYLTKTGIVKTFKYFEKLIEE